MALNCTTMIYVVINRSCLAHDVGNMFDERPTSGCMLTLGCIPMMSGCISIFVSVYISQDYNEYIIATIIGIVVYKYMYYRGMCPESFDNRHSRIRGAREDPRLQHMPRSADS